MIKQTTIVPFNGKDLSATIFIDAQDDDSVSIDDLLPDTTKDEKEALTEQMVRNELQICHINVRIKVDGYSLEGDANLGGVFIRSQDDVLDTVKENHMVEEATMNLIEQMHEILELLSA